MTTPAILQERSQKQAPFCIVGSSIYSTLRVIVFPQCGQVIVFVGCGANSSGTDTPSAAANFSSVSNDGFCLPVDIPERDTRDTPTRSAKSFSVIPWDLQISFILNCIIP